MSLETTYYDLLRINPGCTSAQLTRAFRKMALVYGSEGNPNLRGEKFEAILEAYHVLSDPEKRAAYDRKWRGKLPPQKTTADPAPPSRPASPAAERNRLDIFYNMDVSLQELYCGVYKTLVLEKNQVCDKCETTPQNGCPTCEGEGTVWKKTKYIFSIKKGAQEKFKIRFKGAGDYEPGSERGDLIVLVKMRKHPVFAKMGITLCANVYLTLAESLCGFQRTLRTLDGRELSISSKPGEITPNGCIKYLENEGMPELGSDRRGELLLKFHVMAPKKLDRHTVERLAQTLGWEEPPAPEGIRVPLVNAAEDSTLLETFEMAMRDYETEDEEDDEMY